MEQVHGIRSKLWTTPAYVERLDEHLDALDGRLDALGRHLDALDGRFDALDGRMDALERRMDALMERTDGVCARVDQADQGINGNINFKFDELLFPELAKLRDVLRTYDAQDKRLLWEATRQSGEALDQAKARVFREMAPAEGVVRLLQKANTGLLSALDQLCTEHNIPYWVSHGTLLGAVRHGGPIPWDDDADVGMMRQDIEALREVLADSDRYRVTLVYDWYAKCRQFRFRYADESLPCFVDIFIFDYAETVDLALCDKVEGLREAARDAMDADPALDAWRENPYWEVRTGQDDPITAAIESRFEALREQARALGIGVDGARTGVIWSIDNCRNQSCGNLIRWSFATEDIFPLERVEYEGITCNAPRNSLLILGTLYGDIYSLPGDILSHVHFFNGELEDSESIRALKALVAEGGR